MELWLPGRDVTITQAYVLVVDDDSVNRLLLSRSLEREGHRFATAEDGRRALEMLRAESFDIVLASLHDHALQDADRLTARSLQAIRHPLVNVLCHPANRLVGHSDGYALDFEALYAAAAETGTALEVDGAPSHIDLDGERARAAAQAGVTLSIDSDCHRVEALSRQMGFGVGTARRGWVEARHVLNTRPVDAVREFIAAKRRGARP